MNRPWLDPDEQEPLVADLLRWELIKTSNKRELPLKSGGKTDIYINLREARNHPEAIRRIAGAFGQAVRRLGVTRFVEIPDAVSCFAGPVSQDTGLPYLTIREEAKAGRVVKGKVIGQARRGERVAILDDVVTDGASKIAPYLECLKLGLDVAALVVLVDREQGWKSVFAKEGMDLPVWPGMTLHDVRRTLIRMGAMERCDLTLEGKNPIIVALDGKSWEEYLPLLDRLRTSGCILKVNDLVFDEGIARLLPELSVYGRVMVDLKSHDIPNTVGNICRTLVPHNPWAVTVHASGGAEMVKAAAKELDPVDTKVLAITVLTSIDPKACEHIYFRQPHDQVATLAEIAWEAGANGFVCSPQEVAMLRRKFPEAVLVVPGIRSEGADKGDQQRTGTPKGAMDAGATNIVMGRQLIGAADPVAEVQRVLTEELGIQL
jgi:orotidine-5'-phosphate decarboxylase